MDTYRGSYRRGDSGDSPRCDSQSASGGKSADFYIVIQQIDSHIIMPQVMGAVISLHPVVIIIALLIGGTLFGIAGMVLTVPVTAVLQILCRHLWFYNTYKTKAMNTYGKN